MPKKTPLNGTCELCNATITKKQAKKHVSACLQESGRDAKAMGRKNMLTGVMWLIAGLVVTFSGGSPASGGSFVLLGYGALLFGGVMLVAGLVQLLTAKS